MIGFLHALAAFMLTLVGYSSGTVLAVRDPGARPFVWEVALAAAAALAAATVGPGLLGRWWLLAAAVGGGLVLGLLAASTSILAGRRARSGGAAESDAPDSHPLRRFLLRMGNFQGRLTMAFLYFGLLAPVALLARLGANPLDLEEERGSYWLERERDGRSSTDLRRQS